MYRTSNNVSKFSLTISVIIPVRNEEKNIIALLEGLQNQSLAYPKFEVIIANDSSTDSTATLVNNFISTSELDLKLINLPEIEGNASPKKRAITHCVESAKGEIIVTTDGDCVVKQNWLETILDYFEVHKPVFLSSPVFFSSKKHSSLIQNAWLYFQQIEFASLIVSGAVSIKKGVPNMCSGANIAYLKKAFYAVKGFEGNESIASGDDEFLMHKMSHTFPNQVHYLKSRDAIVLTDALPNWGSFFRQRKRWASKWSYYQSLSPKLMALFIFSSNLAFCIALFTGDTLLVLMKIWPEFLFLGATLVFFGKIRLILWIPLLQLIYPFYVLLFGLSSLGKKEYVWKNRTLK